MQDFQCEPGVFSYTTEGDKQYFKLIPLQNLAKMESCLDINMKASEAMENCDKQELQNYGTWKSSMESLG